ncbi:hypothetical protein SAMN05192534_12373 [Alteribacillus persepolensis]|uniref:Dit-like phage tail protein N-terminal domain-containing protein n=1 Tax=Alteribacillus persepolensis TaxID=568899 RepID=A0A1G8IC60_9BACI|nr:hypothetical protein [Alteribacillus persepolensis]SDI16150.1 hypothetical protein SAMN05192534_12373 [Alteribacillus persepolensis]
MARIGDVEFFLIDETRNYESEVTTHPVERGADVADHIQLNPLRYQITGEVTGSDAAEKHRALLKLRNARDITSYSGRANMSNCIVENYSTNVNVNYRNGFSFTLNIVQARVARPSTVGLLPAELKADTSEVGNAGRVQAQ